MSVEMPERRTATTEKGEARCPGAPSTQEIIAKDKVEAPGWVRSESYQFMGDEDISKDRYIDPAYAKAEFERLWTRTWQFACREEHIPRSRRLSRLRHRLLFVHHHARRQERHPRLLQRLPASRHQAARVRHGRVRERIPVQLPRLELEHRRHEQARRLRLGLPARRPQEILAAASEGRTARRFRVHQHGSGCAHARRVSRPRSEGAHRRVEAGRPLHLSARVQAVPVQLEADDRGLPGGLSRHQSRTRRSPYRTATPTRNTTSMASTWTASSRRSACSARILYGKHTEARHPRPVHARRQRRARQCRPARWARAARRAK